MRIEQIEIKRASNGNEYKQVSIDQKINGKDRFNVFTNHAMYNDMTAGFELDATMLTFDGKYLNLTDPDAGIKGRSGGKSAQMERVMNKKGEMIHQAQENKEESIKLASTIRMAVDMVTAEMEHGEWDAKALNNTERRIEKWRSYFYTNWDRVTQDEPPFASKVGNTNVDYPENEYPEQGF